MKSTTEYFWFNTPDHRAYINITDDVSKVVAKSGVQEGFVLVSAMHITAGVFVNDDEPGILDDIDEWLEGLAPMGEDYEHHNTGETNADSHLKNMLVGHQVRLGAHKSVYHGFEYGNAITIHGCGSNRSAALNGDQHSLLAGAPVNNEEKLYRFY